jgi:hypothetical protein
MGRGILSWRVLLGIAVGAATAWLGALILGEYEFTGALPWIAGPLFGLMVGEVVVGIGRARDVLIGVVVAALSFAGIAWAGWIDSTQGVEPVKSLVWVSAGLAAVVGYLRAAGLPRWA